MKKSDGRRNARIENGKVIRVEWMDPLYFQHWLRNLIGIEECLNVCCGSSPIGTWRLDTSEISNRTNYGDLFECYKSFRPNSIPFVIADVPFNYFNPMDKIIRQKGVERGLEKPGAMAFKWQFDLYDIASKALILKRQLQSFGNFPCKWQEYKLIKDSRPSGFLVEINWK